MHIEIERGVYEYEIERKTGTRHCMSVSQIDYQGLVTMVLSCIH